MQNADFLVLKGGRDPPCLVKQGLSPVGSQRRNGAIPVTLSGLIHGTIKLGKLLVQQ